MDNKNKCELCGFSGKNPSALKKHENSNKHKNKSALASDSQPVTKPSKNFLFCEHCHKKFEKAQLGEHILQSIRDIQFKRYLSVLNVQQMYGCTSITDHLATPKFLRTARYKITELLRIILSGFPTIKYNICLKSLYIRQLTSGLNEEELNQPAIIPFSSLAYQAVRHNTNGIKRDVREALKQMIQREQDFVKRG